MAGILEYLRRKHDDNRSLIKEGWTYYDAYKTKGQAEYYGKMLQRNGKHVQITETPYSDNTTSWKIWYKE